MAGGDDRSRSWTLLFGALAVAMILIGASSGWYRYSDDPAVEGVLRAAAVVFGFASLIVVLKFLVRRRSPRTERPNEPRFTPGVAWIYRRQEATARALQEGDTSSIPIFIELLVNPAEYRARTVETVSLEGRRITQHVSAEYSLPEASLPGRSSRVELFVPILRPLKGELVDGFHLLGSDGSTLADLSYDETIELVSVALRLLIFACLEEEGATDEGGKLREEVVKAETVLLEVIAKRGRIAADEAEQAINDGLSFILTLTSESEDTERLRKFVSLLSTAYPIVAVTPSNQGDGRFIISYTRRIIPRTSAASVKDQLRLILGLRPYQVCIPLDLALTTQSYHVQVEGPTDQYLAGQYLRCRRCQRLLSRDAGRNCSHLSAISDPDTYFRLRRRFGQNYAHVYMRGYARSGHRPLELLVRFGETPPGTLATAVVTSITTAVLIAVVGQLVSDSKHLPDTASDLPALILAFPAFAASWFGFASDTESVLRSSLAARISLICSGVISAISAVLYLSQYSSETSPKQGGWSLVGVSEPSWRPLLLLALINLLLVVSLFVIRSAYYQRLLQRSDPETYHTLGS